MTTNPPEVSSVWAMHFEQLGISQISDNQVLQGLQSEVLSNHLDFILGQCAGRKVTEEKSRKYIRSGKTCQGFGTLAEISQSQSDCRICVIGIPEAAST